MIDEAAAAESGLPHRKSTAADGLSNGMCLCGSHHTVKTARERAE
jgi:hypothetical protein